MTRAGQVKVATLVAAAEALIKVGESARAPGLDPAELAAWTAIGNVLLNLDETITKG